MKKFVNFFYNKGLLLVVLSLAYPPVFLFTKSIHYLEASEILRPLLVIFLLGIIVWGAVWFVTKSIKSSSLATAIFILLFFSFYPIFVFTIKFIVKFFPQLGIEFGFVVWLFLFIILFGVAVTIKPINLSKLIKFLTNTLIIAWIIMLANITYIYLGNSLYVSNKDDLPFINQDSIDLETSPDIYYIVTDGHARSDILEEIYNIDNSDFINFLKQKNFYIAEDSTTNYTQTILSLSASLNMDYIYPEKMSELSTKSFIKKLRDNKIRNLFNNLGYTFISFATGFTPTEITDANRYLFPPATLNEYQMIILGLTPLDAIGADAIENLKANSHQQRVLYTLDNLPELALDPSPKFVLAHIVSPHPPFVFDVDGNFLFKNGFYSLNDGSDYHRMKGQDKDSYIAGYAAQSQFFDRRLQQSLDSLLSNITRPSIIIIQSDHGPGSSYSHTSIADSYLPERFNILNAYYFYDGDYSNLYSDITPVNSFRIILNQYFFANENILEDRNFYSTGAKPFNFTEIYPEQLEKNID